MAKNQHDNQAHHHQFDLGSRRLSIIGQSEAAAGDGPLSLRRMLSEGIESVEGGAGGFSGNMNVNNRHNNNSSQDRHASAIQFMANRLGASPALYP